MKQYWGVLLVLLNIMCVAPVWAQNADESTGFESLIGELTTSSFKKKAKAVEAIAALDDERVLPVMEAMLAGDLYYQKSDEKIVFKADGESGYLITDVLTGTELGEVGKREVKKIATNNRLRKQLRTQIAGYKLLSKKPEIRLAAADDLIKTPSPEFLQVLQTAIDREKEPAVLKALKVARAVILLDSDNEVDRLQAVKDMDGFANKYTMAMLTQLVRQNEDGSYVEPSALVREEANSVLNGLQAMATWYKFVEDVFFGLSLGSVLLLAAVGLAITFGVMGVINMAHGEMIMLGAYTTYVIQLLMPNHIDASLLVAVPAAFVVSGLMGIIIERTVIRHLYGRPLETLLATFGISLILQQLVRSVFSPLNRSVITPDWMSGSLEVNGFLSLTYNRLYIIVFALMVLFGLMLLLKKSFFGLQMRAVTQNRTMASSMGIRTGWVDAMTFGLGSGIAGIAGVALSQLTNVGPNLGQSYIIDSFLVVVFGGVGNLWGTFVAAMSLGLANKFVEPVAGAVLAKILILVFIILFIQRRPRGLFALKGRFVEG
ncbi:MAG: urea ABC transporter permease subunit UrtB [Pseudomonadales bacterium]|nr:urea ABC transporter permease subunit UrtB [Pseudomonadales bacterium]MBI27470.1 urea ABC transporter permease subunit UrtB [Pseudomonadales bacterium]HAG93545.1 urea ABC transporter permease subunit UrtB [Gammaproteobacteria bacterium]HAU12380.1 urea ABC transporter permease subunit UrtB [Gammaproteobacteria bacterium]